MDITQPLALLGGISPQTFMKRHWQKRPLLIRQAISGFSPLLDRNALFDLAARDDVESRLVRRTAKGWRLASGPFLRRALPGLKTPDWTLLVQGVDAQHAGVRQLMDQFRFVPDARLDDVMISYASPGGGVGPHFDSYDVFLLQAHGKRRWTISAQKDLTLQAGAPLKILQNFQAEQTFDLEPGDMLYLPPRYAHDGVALGECMTYSIGFRAPKQQELALALIQRMADGMGEGDEAPAGDILYRDRGQMATPAPAQMPPELVTFARHSVQAVLGDADALARALGEYLTEPKAQVWFEQQVANSKTNGRAGLRLDPRTRMLFDDKHIFINGESFRASGRDARLMRDLANDLALPAAVRARLSAEARGLVEEWVSSGWLLET